MERPLEAAMLDQAEVDKLPHHILEKILGFFDSKEQWKLRRCCQRFALVMPFNTKFDLDVFYDPKTLNSWITPSVLSIHGTRTFESTRSVKTTCWVGSEVAAQISEAFPNLQHLEIANRQGFHLDALRHFSALKTLRVPRLYLSHAEVDPRCYQVLGSVKLPEQLSTNSYILRKIADNTEVPGLLVVEIQGDCDLRMQDFELFSRRFPNLVQISFCKMLEGFSVSWLSGFAKLERLAFAGSVVFGIPTRHIRPVNITTLAIEGSCSFQDFSFLSYLPCLRYVWIHERLFTSNDFGLLSKSAALTNLHLDGTQAPCDELLDILHDRKDPLKHLGVGVEARSGDDGNIRGFSTNALISYLKGGPGLEVLSLNGHQRIDDSIFDEDCAIFGTLEELDVRGTRCRRRGIMELCKHREARLLQGLPLPFLTIRVNEAVAFSLEDVAAYMIQVGGAGRPKDLNGLVCHLASLGI